MIPAPVQVGPYVAGWMFDLEPAAASTDIALRARQSIQSASQNLSKPPPGLKPSPFRATCTDMMSWRSGAQHVAIKRLTRGRPT